MDSSPRSASFSDRPSTPSLQGDATQGLVYVPSSQTAGRRPDPIHQFALELRARASSYFRRLYVAGPSCATPACSPDVGHCHLGHVLSLVPSDTVGKPGRGGRKAFPTFRPEPQLAIKTITKMANPEASSRRRRLNVKNGVTICSFSVSVSTKPRNRLTPVIVLPSARPSSLGERLAGTMATTSFTGGPELDGSFGVFALAGRTSRDSVVG